MEKNIIAVGLCTYKRPELLYSCLESLFTIEKPVNNNFLIIITDNDPEGSARPIVEKFIKKAEIPVLYKVEKRRGIPFARNNILKQAGKLGVTELAFLDDDETADKFWLSRLFNYYIESGSDVVRGYVKTLYPDDTPEWIKNGQFYQRKNRRTGERFTSASTNNVLFNFNKLCVEKRLEFDNSIGLRGGSDSDFFRRAYLEGAVITWKDDAVVYETLEKERYKLTYLLKRKFRTRNSRTFFKSLTAAGKIKIFAVSVFKIIKGIFFLPFGFCSGKHRIITALCSITEGSGRLLGLFGIHPGWDEYDEKD